MYSLSFSQFAAAIKKNRKIDPSILISPEVAEQTWINLQKALEQLQTKTETLDPDNNDADDDDDDDDDDDEKQNNKMDLSDDDEVVNGRPSTKRQKRETRGDDENDDDKKTKPKKIKVLYAIADPYNIYRHTIRKPIIEDDEDPRLVEDEAAREMKDKMGGKLSQLTVSGIINGMAGHFGGVVLSRKLQLIPEIPLDSIPSAKGASFAQIKHIAQLLHKSIQTRIEEDVLVTTPIRIQEMLAPDISSQEFKGIRKRIYDTVILGKGLSQPEVSDVPTASNHQSIHDSEKFKKCKSCGNHDQSLFVLDRKNGDVICSLCGTVHSSSLMHEGSQFRKFEGEVDRNHHGDTANPLYSNAHNMSTTLGGIQMTTGAGVGGFGSQKRGLEIVLRNAHAYTELNLSTFGKGDKRTRTGYKDKQKKDAFIQMSHVGDALNLHEAVVQRAKELFSGFRDDRELVQQFKGVVAACLCEAFEQLSSDGRQILKQIQEAPIESFANPRANRRNDLHHANLAGKGGLLLDFDANEKEEEKEENQSSVSRKLISSWDLEDCRSWLMEASRSIAQEWIEERKKGVKEIPSGTLEELEGQMVEHSISLCDGLESELRNFDNKTKGDLDRGRVNTPRVNNMAKLGIKWQHSHERGSGGKGGVGGSGHTQIQRSGRTAGQILILKSAKKIGEIVNDQVAGEAIHKELRSIVNKQDALKRKKLSEESTRQRFAQMKRKPWLQARAQIDT
jgi:hypothetical protein